MEHNKLIGHMHSARQRGVGLIELLVSILIFASGMLGLVGLQTRTLSFSQASLYRSQATALTDDILDRMRADRTNAKAGMWNTTVESGHKNFTDASLAQMNLKDWKLQIETLLPSGKAAIALDKNKVTITITWEERDFATKNGFATQTFETASSL